MKKALGMITIGQTPRVDVTPDLKKIWGDDILIIEKGALDGLSQEEIEGFKPQKDDYTLVTRLRDGSHAVIAKKYILPRLQNAIDELNAQEIPLILLLCTGAFPEFKSKAIIIRPQAITHKTVAAIAAGKTVGVITPLPDQVMQCREKWLESGVDIEVECGSPYGPKEDLIQGIKRLSEHDLSFIVLDCMGYSTVMKDKVKEMLNIPVILPRTLIARIIQEMIS